MFQNIKKLTLILALLSLNGCNADNNKESDKNVTKINTKLAYKETKPQNRHKKEQDDKLLHKIGITATSDKIVIEPKKTKEFFDKLAKTLEKSAKELEEKNRKIQKTDIGISANKDKIIIDLNKTKTFLDKFSKELENVAKNIDRAINQ